VGARINSPIARVPSSRYVQPIHSSDAAKGEGRERTATEHTSRPGSSTAIDLRKRVALLKGGGRASCGARSRDLSLTYHTRGCLGRVLAPIDRRRGAEEEGGVGPGGAGAGASLHREDWGRARARGTAERSTEVSTAPGGGGGGGRGSDLPSPGGLPTFRSNRLDRPEPSQHAPLLPATPTTRLGPSASRRPETRKSSARLRVVGAGSW